MKGSIDAHAFQTPICRAFSRNCRFLPIAAACLAAGSKFKIGVISDEVSEDFDHACYVISKQFGLHCVERREIWGKNLQTVSDDEIARAQKILAMYDLQVTDISSPLYKVDRPEAPHSQYGSKEDLHGADETKFNQQQEVLERSISLAKQLKTNKVRCFDFRRIELSSKQCHAYWLQRAEKSPMFR